MGKGKLKKREREKTGVRKQRTKNVVIGKRRKKMMSWSRSSMMGHMRFYKGCGIKSRLRLALSLFEHTYPALGTVDSQPNHRLGLDLNLKNPEPRIL